jgi:hypothetical protein
MPIPRRGIRVLDVAGEGRRARLASERVFAAFDRGVPDGLAIDLATRGAAFA